ncbi:MAG: VCBS repeat-containing protein [Acidobacteriota bacterium]|jgi:hypothetical protein
MIPALGSPRRRTPRTLVTLAVRRAVPVFARMPAALLPLLLSAAGLAGPVRAGDVPYPPTPDWESVAPGYCGTGLAFADLDGDGWKDMVVSNGNDIAKQQVFVHLNRGDGTFPKAPDWTSEDYAYNGNLSVGDVNGDGRPDVAVSVYTGPNHTYSGGGAKLYLNQGSGGGLLEPTPSWQVSGFPSFGCALGDADGDGDLDLAVAAGNPIAETETFASQPDCKQPYRKAGGTYVASQEPPYESNGFVFYNEGGTLGSQPGWISDDKLVAMDVTFADVNQDGAIDLVYADPRPAIYLGDGTGGISRTPGWRATDTSHFSNQLAFAATLDVETTDDKARVSSLLVAGNSYMGGGPGRFDLYRFASSYVLEYNPKTASPSWSSPLGGWGSGVLFADADQDGDLDLYAGRWAPPGSGVLGAPIEIYPGNGNLFADRPAWTSETSSVLEVFAVADLRNRALRTGRADFAPAEGEAWSVLTLPVQTVEGVSGVTVDGRTLPAGAYNAPPGTNLVYLAEPLESPRAATVTYRTSPVLDLGVTNWDCAKGNYLFYSRYGE